MKIRHRAFFNVYLIRYPEHLVQTFGTIRLTLALHFKQTLNRHFVPRVTALGACLSPQRLSELQLEHGRKTEEWLDACTRSEAATEQQAQLQQQLEASRRSPPSSRTRHPTRGHQTKPLPKFNSWSMVLRNTKPSRRAISPFSFARS